MNYHPTEKSIALPAASLSSSRSVMGSYHMASRAIPIWPPCLSWIIKIRHLRVKKWIIELCIFQELKMTCLEPWNVAHKCDMLQHEIRECGGLQCRVQWMIFPSYIKNDPEWNIFQELEFLNRNHGGQSYVVHWKWPSTSLCLQNFWSIYRHSAQSLFCKRINTKFITLSQKIHNIMFFFFNLHDLGA